MKLGFFCVVLSVIHVSLTLVFTDKDGVTVKYKVSMGTFCGNEGESFKKIVKISLAECAKECGIRQHCEGLRYHRRYPLCELISGPNEGPQNDGSCIFIPASDIVVEQMPCRECEHGQMCDIDTAQCMYKECAGIDLNNTLILGNMKGIANKIRLRCDGWYAVRESRSKHNIVCMNNGNWNTTYVCEKLTNVALSKPTEMSGYHPDQGSNGNLGVDGDATTYFHTSEQSNSWWRVNLENEFEIFAVMFYNRHDCCQERASNVSLCLGSIPNSLTECTIVKEVGEHKIVMLPEHTFARYVHVSLNSGSALHLGEVEVFAFPL